jgi:acetyl/propionyl-CoA carboxylase alpha subunit
VEEGQEIPIHYDPMLSKLVVQGHTREAAIERAIVAIDEYEITGVSTTLDFGRFAINHEAFRSGNFDTHFVNTHFHDGALDRPSDLADADLAKLVIGMIEQSPVAKPLSSETKRPEMSSNWKKRRLD